MLMAAPAAQLGSGAEPRRSDTSAASTVCTGGPSSVAATPSTTLPVMDIFECPCCEREFSLQVRRPQVLSCGHTVCELCSTTGKHRETCDSLDHDVVSENLVLLQLLGEGRENSEDLDYFISMAYRQICTLAALLRPSPTTQAPALSRPMLRKLLAFVNSNLEEPFGLNKALKAARSLAERSLVEVILEQQSSGQLTASLWAAVRARGCQFLGPAMQEEVLKLVLLALEDGSALSRKVLVMFVVQRLSTLFPHASKTSIGHVVQLLYRASCFVVAKREGDSSLMQLKEEFRTYESLRREHDAQIVSIACEAGLRIAPEQWSSLLYGDGAHRSHMQSIIDRLQAPQSLEQTAKELASLATRANHLPLASRLQLLQQPLKVLEWQPEDVASSGGKAVFDFISAAVSTVHYCLSLLQQQQHQQSQQNNGHSHKTTGSPSPIFTHFQPQQQQQTLSQQQQQGQHQFHLQASHPNPHTTSNCVNNNSSNNNIVSGVLNSIQNAVTPPPTSHPLPHQVYKYKVNLCRDMNNFGVCPRGAGCTFAHSIREQEHFRMRGKQASRLQPLQTSSQEVSQLSHPTQQQQLQSLRPQQSHVHLSAESNHQPSTAFHGLAPHQHQNYQTFKKHPHLQQLHQATVSPRGQQIPETIDTSR